MSQYILSCRSEEGWQKTIEEEREMIAIDVPKELENVQKMGNPLLKP